MVQVDGLKEYTRDDRHHLTADEWSAVVRKLKNLVGDADMGWNDEAGTVSKTPPKFMDKWFKCLPKDDIPANSLFAVSTDAIASIPDGDPVEVFPAKYGTKNSGSPLMLMTNGDMPMKSCVWGWGRPISYHRQSRVRYNPGLGTPRLGLWAGLALDSYEADASRQGLNVLRVDTANSMIDVVRSPHVRFYAIVTQRITPFKLPNKLGKGKVAIWYRKNGNNQLKLGKGVPSGEDHCSVSVGSEEEEIFEVDVWNYCCFPFEVGKPVEIEEVLGVGLCVTEPCSFEDGSCSSSSSSSGSSSSASSESSGSSGSSESSRGSSESSQSSASESGSDEPSGSAPPSEGSGSEPCVSDRITVSGEPRLESVDPGICGSGQEHEEVWRLVIPKLTLFTEDGCLRSEDAGEFSALICCCQEPGSSSSSSSSSPLSGSDEPSELSSASSSSSSSSSSSCGDCPADIDEPTRFNSCSVDADGFHLGWDFDPDPDGDCYSFDVEGSFDDSNWDRLVTETKNKSNANPGEGDACWNACCASPPGNTDSGLRHFYFNPPISPFYSFFRVRAVCDADTSQTSDWTHLTV